MISRSFTFLVYIYFFLAPFHGLIRTLGYAYGFPWLKGWKELLLLILLTLWLLLVLTGYGRSARGGGSAQVLPSFWLAWSATVTVGLLGIIVGAYHDMPLSQGFWGLKVEYLPLLWFPLLLSWPTLAGPRRLIRPEILAWGYAWLSIPIVLFGWWQWCSGWNNYTELLLGGEAYGVVAGSKFSHIAGVLRPISTFSEPPAFGGWCGLVALCVVSLILLQPGIKATRRFFLYTVFLCCIWGTFLSTSRSSVLFLVVGITILLLLRLLGPKKKLLAALVTVVPPSALAMTAYLVVSLHQHGTTAPLLTTTSTYERLSLWRASLASFADGGLATWLFGFGTGYAGVAQFQIGIQQWNFVDSVYLLLTLNHGLVGLTVWLWFLVAILRQLVAGVRAGQGINWLAAAFLAAWTGWLCEFAFRATIEGYPVQAYLWGFTGLAITQLPETDFHKLQISKRQRNRGRNESYASPHQRPFPHAAANGDAAIRAGAYERDR